MYVWVLVCDVGVFMCVLFGWKTIFFKNDTYKYIPKP